VTINRWDGYTYAIAQGAGGVRHGWWDESQAPDFVVRSAVGHFHAAFALAVVVLFIASPLLWIDPEGT
jgi:hypothetical protein